MSEWISVDERPPEGDCIVFEQNSNRAILAYEGEWEAVDWDVTHWMSLPEPPKEAEKNHHLYSNVAPKSGGPFSLYCESCKCWVPNTANAEMRKEGLYAYSHWCKDGLCDMRNGEIKEATP